MDIVSALEQRIPHLVEQTGVPGVAVAVVQEGEPTYAKAFGSLSLETPLPVASLTKPIFAYAVLKLCERGVIKLDTPLAEYLPEPYLTHQPYLPIITTRHVLSHTSGFPNWRDENGLRTAFRPGTAFHYSTEGLIYLQTVVEHLTRQPLLEYLHDNIFVPLGMSSSQLVPEDLSLFLSYLPRGLRAYGGISLTTTAPDYARFLTEMVRLGNSSHYLLSIGMIEEMLTPHSHVGDQNNLDWGLGWGLQHILYNRIVFWHWGARRLATRNFAAGDRKRQSGVVIFTNHANGLTLCEEIAQIALEIPEPLPAFNWLLPAERWRADGFCRQ